jgi:hypothetical protein
VRRWRLEEPGSRYWSGCYTTQRTGFVDHPQQCALQKDKKWKWPSQAERRARVRATLGPDNSGRPGLATAGRTRSSPTCQPSRDLVVLLWCYSCCSSGRKPAEWCRRDLPEIDINTGDFAMVRIVCAAARMLQDGLKGRCSTTELRPYGVNFKL